MVVFFADTGIAKISNNLIILSTKPRGPLARRIFTDTGMAGALWHVQSTRFSFFSRTLYQLTILACIGLDIIPFCY